RRVLAAMLEDGQAVIKLTGNVLVADDSDDAAHVRGYSLRSQRPGEDDGGGGSAPRGGGPFSSTGVGSASVIVPTTAPARSRTPLSPLGRPLPKSSSCTAQSGNHRASHCAPGNNTATARDSAHAGSCGRRLNA